MATDDGLLFPPDDDTKMAAPEGALGEPWKLLVVDDADDVHQVTRLALRDVRFDGRPLQLISAYSAREAKAALRDEPDIALILLDVVMESDDAGLRLVEHIRQTLGNTSVRIVLRTGQPGEAPEASVIASYDISDYKAKTELTATRLFTTVVAALRTYRHIRALVQQQDELRSAEQRLQAAYDEVTRLKGRIEQERDYLREEVREALQVRDMVGASEAFVQLLSRVAAVAETPATVLITGESGVGKELVARTLHERSRRAEGPLVKVNCAAIPRELFESEFFGHVRGSFTGATRDRPGRFELADGGTLFLDEVGEIPLELQSKLLRVLEEQELQRVGSSDTRRVDVRVVAATNRRLEREVEAGRFREDLFYRLNVFPLEVPPLRERRADVAPLARYFLRRACSTLGREALQLSDEDERRLAAHPWPGNVRELQNVIERAVILSQGGRLCLDAAMGPPESAPRVATTSAATPAKDATTSSTPPPFVTVAELRERERQNYLAALEHAGWRVAGVGGAADLLGIPASTLSYQLKTLGITRPAR